MLPKKQLKIFHNLILRYESITVEEIEQAISQTSQIGVSYKTWLTGFNSHDDCTLCKYVIENETDCVYGDCNQNPLSECGEEAICTKHSTYRSISEAFYPQELLQAYSDRALFMREWLDNLGEEQPIGVPKNV